MLPPDTSPLFSPENPDISCRLRAIFDAWVKSRTQQPHAGRANRELNEASAKVYQEMWFAFADYCAVHSLDLETLTRRQIENFLTFRARGQGNARMAPKGPALSPRYAWRMLTLIDRVTCFAAEREGKRPNRTVRELLELPEYRYANARLKDPLPEYYEEPQVQQIIQYLGQMSSEDGQNFSWKVVRDCTAVALMLGAGLTPGDVRTARVTGVFQSLADEGGTPWKISLPGNGNAPARETPVAAWAGLLLGKWLNVRKAQDVPGDVLFPSTLSGKPLSHATCYKVCKAVLEAVGIEDENGGVFKLRHTFALRQLADGKSEYDVARWLGLLDINGMARYRRIVKGPIDLV